jgi:hypothetical protein
VSLLQTIVRTKRASKDQRQSPRRKVQFPAWIDIGNDTAPRNCTVVDVSDGGARVMVEASSDLPKEFYLVLTKSGTRRRCRLVWSSEQEIGVFYLGPIEFWHLSAQST